MLARLTIIRTVLEAEHIMANGWRVQLPEATGTNPIANRQPKQRRSVMQVRWQRRLKVAQPQIAGENSVLVFDVNLERHCQIV